jgi:hypothetical protein
MLRGMDGPDECKVMPPTRLAISAVLALCWCVGCDTIRGVSRTLPVNALPSPDAIEQAIRATPGVTEVTRRDPGFPQFNCRDTASAFATVEPRQTNGAGKRLYIYCKWMNHVPTKDELSNARGLIDRVCNSLHSREPVVPASSSSDDEFMGIKAEGISGTRLLPIKQ